MQDRCSGLSLKRGPSPKRKSSISTRPSEEISLNLKLLVQLLLQISSNEVIGYKNEALLRGKCPNLHFIVFNTEPWTLTACKGIAVHPQINYVVLETAKTEHYIMASQRYEHHKAELKKIGAVPIMRCLGEFFLDMRVKDPLLGKEIPVCYDSEIRPAFGSGVHPVCPGHFIDDLRIAQVVDFWKIG